MRNYRWLKPYEGPKLEKFLSSLPPEPGMHPLQLNWRGTISDWLVEERDGVLRCVAHVVLSKPMAYCEGLALAPDLTGFSRARSVHQGYHVMVALARRAGCSAIRFVVSERHRVWLDELQRRGVQELEEPYRVMIQEL